MKREEIQQIVDEQYVEDWVKLDPTVYYKDDVPYGLLSATLGQDGVYYVASTAKKTEHPFTKNMIRDIIRLYEAESMCLLSGHPPSWGKLASALERYGFDYVYIDNVMYAFHIKDSHET